jgi:hypothetical protein
VTEDLHSPTTAGPEPAPAGAAMLGEAPVTVPPAHAGPAADRPELLVGAAFAGGFVAAMILRRFNR